MSGPDFEFEPPNRRRVWKQLSLTMSQAATLTGVSERQIQHWMNKGYIAPRADGSRRVDGESLDLVLLVKQARDAGIPLRRASVLAHQYLARESSALLESDLTRWPIQDLRERLALARAGIEAVEGILDGKSELDGTVRVRRLSGP